MEDDRSRVDKSEDNNLGHELAELGGLVLGFLEIGTETPEILKADEETSDSSHEINGGGH